LIEINRAATQGRSPTLPASDHALICFSHLRWNFVFQRPQHLMSRFAAERRVIVWEEPVYGEFEAEARMTICPQTGVEVVVPHLPHGLDEEGEEAALRALLDGFTAAGGPFIRWYYTPMMLAFSAHLPTAATVYDCMDELASFRFAPPRLLPLEQALLSQADVVFTGGFSLYEVKKNRHANVHAFPVERRPPAFHAGAGEVETPVDQIAIPGRGSASTASSMSGWTWSCSLLRRRAPRLVAGDRRAGREDRPGRSAAPPEPALPGRQELCGAAGLSGGWDVALMPFAINESTRFISPTKTPEYLAGGKPVVSTPVKDVIRHYGDLEGVAIAEPPTSSSARATRRWRCSRAANGWPRWT
jgi:UDP-galactopyranose mutase